MTDCIFCNIIAGSMPTEFIHEDDRVVVFKDIRPKASTHLLLVPKLHINSLADIDSSHTELMAYLVSMLPKVAAMQNLSGFRTIVNTGRESGQEVDHLHFHILSGGRLPGF